MKKFIILLCAVLLTLGVTGCGAKTTDTAQYDDLNTTSSDAGVNAQYDIVLAAIEEAYADGTPENVEDVVRTIATAMPVGDPAAEDPMADGSVDVVTTDILSFLQFNVDAIEEVSGLITRVNVSSNELVVIRAKDGMVDTVVEDFIKRRDDKVAAFAEYLPTEYEKALHSKIVVKGNDVIFANLGDVEQYDMFNAEG